MLQEFDARLIRLIIEAAWVHLTRAYVRPVEESRPSGAPRYALAA